MKKDKNKKSSNNKQGLNLPVAQKLGVNILENGFGDMYKSLIFKLYIKSILINKALSLKANFEFQIFSKKIKLIVENHYIENLAETENFMINDDTELEIFILEDSLSTLSIEQKQLSEFDKIDFLKKNCENFYEYKNENVDLIGMEEEYAKIKTIVDYNLFEDVDKKLSISNPTSTDANNYGQTALNIQKKFTYKVYFEYQPFYNSESCDFMILIWKNK